MKKAEFLSAMTDLINQAVEGLSLDGKAKVTRQLLVEAQKKAQLDPANKGAAWTDEELRMVLQHAPTKENCLLLARAFRRGYGSIEQIFRWAATADPAIAAKRPEDKFVKQVKRIAKEVGWRATG